jgi:hypothetical protein
MKPELSQHIFKKYSNIKCLENQFSVRRVAACGQTNRQKDMMKLTVTFHNFVNMPKKE